MARVLYIAGTGRSGSTLLANILGELPGVFTAGEVRYLWQRGWVDGRLCGCGVPVPSCPVWTAILADARSGAAPDPKVLAQLLRKSGRVRHLPRTLVGQRLPRWNPASGPELADVRAVLGDVYTAIARVTSSRVVVDSSKLPAYANLLAAIPGIDLRVVHLIRDPRGAAHSWSSRKALGDGAERSHMQEIGPLKSAALWDLWNAAGAAILDRGDGRYLRLRYEDLMADPVGALGQILPLLGIGDVPLPVVEDGRIRLGPNHSVAGNPDRLRHGAVQLRHDTRWLSSMRARDRLLVTTVTAPLLLRYGYPVRVPSSDTARGQSRQTVLGRAPLDESSMRRFTRRVRLHLHWARTEGIGRLVEEDELNPITRAQVGFGKWRWRRSHPQPVGLAMPVYIVGLQRSGTNMLTRGLDRTPEFEVHNENDREAFDRFMLRSDETIRRIVMRSHHRYVLFKPLCDSHRIDRILDSLGSATPGRAIWAFRDVDGRVRSALSKFGHNNLQVLAEIAAGRPAGMWQAQRLSDLTLEMIGSFSYRDMTPETAAALFWWVRNSLYFELGLDRRPDVTLSSYQELLADPARAMGRICAFLGLEYRPELVAHIAPRPPRDGRPLAIDPRVRSLCDQLQNRLDATLRDQQRSQAA